MSSILFTEYTKNNFLVNFQNTTILRRHIQIVETKIINKIHIDIINLSLGLFRVLHKVNSRLFNLPRTTPCGIS